MECWASIPTLTFGITGTAELSALRAGRTLPPRKFLISAVARHSSVSIATHYGLDGPGIQLQLGGEIFRTRPDRPWDLPSPLYNEYDVFTGGKAAEAWR